jgi:glucosamine--fructose-6-phosphate aminotransferase (isomerizing)
MKKITLMRKEAIEAPQCVDKQLSENVTLWESICNALKKKKVNFAATVARGSSDHAATFAKYLIETRMGIVTSSIAPSIFSIYQSAPQMDDALLIGISQSGKSPDLVHSFNSSSKGAMKLAIVNKADSPLARASNYVIPLLAGEEKSVAATKSYIASLVALVHFISIYTKDTTLKKAINELPEYLESASNLDWSYGVEALIDQKDAYIIARGYSYGIAQEAALKLKETSCLHSEPFSSSEVLHGPFALIKNNFPIIMFSQNDQSAKGSIKLAEKMTRMGAKVMFAMPGNKNIDVSYNFPVTRSLHPLLDPILLIQSFYLMASELSVERGLNPDQPDNLNKVTETM